MESEDTEQPECSTDQELETATRRWRDEVQEWVFEGDSAAFDKEIRGWTELCGWKCVTFHMNPGYVRREIEKEQEEEFHNVLVCFVTSLFVRRRPRPDVGEQLNELHRKVDLLLDSALFGAAHRGHVQQGADAGVRALLEFEDTESGASSSARVLQNAAEVNGAGLHVLPSAANTEVGAETSATGFSSTSAKEHPRKAPVAAEKTSQLRSRKVDKQQNSKLDNADHLRPTSELDSSPESSPGPVRRRGKRAGRQVRQQQAARNFLEMLESLSQPKTTWHKA